VANIFLWTVLLTSIDTSDDKNTKTTRKYIVSAVSVDLAVSYASRKHDSVWIHSRTTQVLATCNRTNVISAGKVG
jgi:hypothetical protein